MVSTALLMASTLAACTTESSLPQAQPPSAPAPSTEESSAPTIVLPSADPELTPAGRAACGTLIAALPDTLADQPRNATGATTNTGPEASWGDPAIRLRCGVAAPAGFDPRAVPDLDEPAPCIKVSGVGWYVDPTQIDGDVDAVLSAVTYTPRVAVLVPQTYLPEGSAAALAELAEPIRRILRRSLRCG